MVPLTDALWWVQIILIQIILVCQMDVAIYLNVGKLCYSEKLSNGTTLHGKWINKNRLWVASFGTLRYCSGFCGQLRSYNTWGI